MVATLPDGRVLVAGGGDLIESPYRTVPPTNRSAELYDPRTDTWLPLPPMPENRAGGAPVVLMDGSVLLVGGRFFRAPSGQLEWVAIASAIRFVPSP